MRTRIIRPTEPLPPTALDDYLTDGWRPSGQAIYTSNYLRTNADAVHGVLQVRIPLADFSFKKRHRKLLRRNASRFRTTVERAGYPDAELRAVNARYMAVHPEKTREDLEIHVVTPDGVRVLDTHLIRVYDGDRLVAFSYFDLGVTRAYAKAGIYDPDYQQDSLGIYTFLLELEYVLANGYTHYHPGYVSPTFPAFHYKLSFGPVEVRRLSDGTWMTYTEELARALDPLERSRTALKKLLVEAGPELGLELMEYISFTARYHYPDNERVNLLDGGVLVVYHDTDYAADYVVTYDPATERYQVLDVEPTTLTDNTTRQNVPGRVRYYPWVLNVDGRLLAADKIGAVLNYVAYLESLMLPVGRPQR